MTSISVVKQYLPVIKVPREELRQMIVAGATQEASKIGVPLYNPYYEDLRSFIGCIAHLYRLHIYSALHALTSLLYLIIKSGCTVPNVVF